MPGFKNRKSKKLSYKRKRGGAAARTVKASAKAAFTAALKSATSLLSMSKKSLEIQLQLEKELFEIIRLNNLGKGYSDFDELANQFERNLKKLKAQSKSPDVEAGFLAKLILHTNDANEYTYEKKMGGNTQLINISKRMDILKKNLINVQMELADKQVKKELKSRK